MIPLDLLPAGEEARIAAVDGDQEGVRRLAELGLRPGAQVRMVRGGSPCILAVGERSYSLRLTADTFIWVEPGES